MRLDGIKQKWQVIILKVWVWVEMTFAVANGTISYIQNTRIFSTSCFVS
jgi:hypothetical protein